MKRAIGFLDFRSSNLKWKTAKRKWLALSLVVFVCVVTGTMAEPQEPKRVPRVGLLTLLPAPDPREEAFLLGLRELGYTEGQNITIDYRRAAGKIERLTALAEELVRLKVDLIVARSTPAIEAAKNATKTIPIVMLGAADPVGSGFVASLARPGGNITGNSNINPELAGKRLELLREILPKLSRVAFLAYGGDPAHKLFMKEAREAAEKLRISIRTAVVGKTEEIEPELSKMNRDRTEALIIQTLFITGLGQGRRIAELAAESRLPTISDGPRFAEFGGLLFYGPDLTSGSRRAAIYVDKILKGANPSDLPVEQPTKFELMINLKAAKQIGLTVPHSVLARADRVIK